MITYLFDALALAGGALVAWGLALVWPPLGVIFVGLALCSAGILGARRWDS